jgi:hypothetical protein
MGPGANKRKKFYGRKDQKTHNLNIFAIDLKNSQLHNVVSA